MNYLIKLVSRIGLKITSIYVNYSLVNSTHVPRIHGRNIVLVSSVNIQLGKNVAFNSNLYINATYKITIGNDVALSDGVKLITVTLNYKINPMNSAHVGGGIQIGNNVQIGAGSILLPGIIIGDNVVIGAGSVVTKNIESNSVAAGNPAKVLKRITYENNGEFSK